MFPHCLKPGLVLTATGFMEPPASFWSGFSVCSCSGPSIGALGRPASWHSESERAGTTVAHNAL